MTEKGSTFIFTHIPKTGGNWVREEVRQLGTVVRQPFHGKPREEDIQGKMVFCFVRHPVLWLRSFWGIRTRSNWEIGGRDYWRDICHILQPCAFMDFGIFAECVVSEHPGIIGYFFDWFMVPGMRVGRTERLTQDLKEFLPQLRIRRGATNVGRNLPTVTRRTWNQICEAEKATIEKYYHDGLVTYENYRSFTMTEQEVDPKKVKQAAEALDVDVPIMGARMLGNRIELHLYGGAVVTWAQPAAKKRTAAKKKVAKKRD